MRRILQITSIVLLTVLLLGFFLWKSNLTDVWRILKRTNIAWFLCGMLVNLLALIVRTVRWRILINYPDPPPFYPTFFANTTGYALSAALPIRASDVARPALLARRTDVRFSQALGAVLTERIMDLFSILVLLLYFSLHRWNDFNDSVVHGGAFGAGVILFALSALMFVVYVFPAHLRRVHVRIGRVIPMRFRDAWMRFFDTFAGTVQLARVPAAAALVIASTAAIWLCLISQYWFVLLASHRVLPLDAALFLSAATTVGVAIPTPGGVGGFHKMCQWVLTTYYGFDIDSSVAVAVLLHIVSTLPVLIAGLALLLREGLSWRDLSRETSAEET